MKRPRKAPTQEGSSKMSSEMKETPTRVTVEHFLAGLSVWAVMMAIYAIA